ncbi:carbohydrate ABC transporter permease [Blautia sp. OF03-15BH]|uniref:carbohydrate ABC transporter permease n=1 Tax=Blautia sp. OF03-15BH TaxID=2292287 RepID=UPI000E4978E2|nr:carbohydrate ABC transporter permease [Blautia sp. OF03-15BH]RGX98258.1 carbohydrate ABC transporter permease [Blautia sp. OF03-15BH]
MRKKNKRVTGFDIGLYTIFGILGLLTLYPFYYVLIVSFANTQASATYSPYLYPHVFDLTGYQMIIGDIYFFKSLMTTLFVTAVGTSLNMVISVMTAYVLSRKRLLGRKQLIVLITFTMLFSGGLIPTYLVVSNLGLINSIWAMIFPGMISTYYVIIMKNYFSGLPQSLEDAAKIDGANDLKVLYKIYLPISKPFMATFALFYAVERWNEWWNAYLYISDKNIKPLQIYLRDILVNFSNQLSTQAQSVVNSQGKVYVQSVQMATIVITMLPIMCLYPFLQKYFVKGVMIGAIKE